MSIVIYLERTRFQCLTKQEREEDAAYAKLEAARKANNDMKKKDSVTTLGGAPSQNLKEKEKQKDDNEGL